MAACSSCQHQLCAAAAAGHVTCVRALLHTPTREVDTPRALLDSVNVRNCRDGGKTPISWAALNGHVECVRALMDGGADVNKGGGGGTPIFYAARRGHVECVRALMDGGADVNEGLCNITPISWAAWDGHVDCVRALMHGGADVNKGSTRAGPPAHLRPDAAWKLHRRRTVAAARRAWTSPSSAGGTD